MVIPPRDREGRWTPERRRRRSRAIAVAIGVAILLLVLNGAFSSHWQLAPLIILLIIVFMIRRLVGSPRTRRRLEETGTPATARIVDVRDTYANIWDKRIMVFQLEILQPGMAGRTVRARALIPHSDMKRYTVGTMVQIRYDPADPDDVVVTGLAVTVAPAPSPAPSPAVTAPEPDEIAAAEALNQQLKTNGALCRANVLEVHETGLTRNGDPFLKFRLEVRPIGGEPYKAQAAAVIRTASLSEYQPGHDVWVKHDPKQPGRVALYNT